MIVKINVDAAFPLHLEFLYISMVDSNSDRVRIGVNGKSQAGQGRWMLWLCRYIMDHNRARTWVVERSNRK